MQFFCSFHKNMLGKLLGFGCMHENKIFLFFERGNEFKSFEIFFNFHFFKKHFKENLGCKHTFTYGNQN
jgi:hypothetical protein